VYDVFFEPQVERAILDRRKAEFIIRVAPEYFDEAEAVADLVNSVLDTRWGRLFGDYMFISFDKLESLEMAHFVVHIRADLLALLKDFKEIEGVFENITVKLEPPPSTGITVTMGETAKYIGADKAWQVGLTGKNIVGAVLDTGSNPKHPLLKGKYLAEEIAFKYPYNSPENSPIARHFHGPGMQSIFLTVAPDAKVVSVKVFPASGSTTLNVIYRGIDRAIAHKPDIMLASWGSSRCSEDLHHVLEKAFAVNPRMVFSVSMGNSGWKQGVFKPGWGGQRYPSIGCPADMANLGAIATGALAIRNPYPDAIANFSSRGPPPYFVMSPGGGQQYRKFGDEYLFDRGRLRYPRYMLVEDAERILVADTSFGYIVCRGTSPAQPHTAGAIALLMEAYPNGELASIYTSRIKQTARILGDAPNNDSGFGCVDIWNAVNLRR